MKTLPIITLTALLVTYSAIATIKATSDCTTIVKTSTGYEVKEARCLRLKQNYEFDSRPEKQKR